MERSDSDGRLDRITCFKKKNCMYVHIDIYDSNNIILSVYSVIKRGCIEFKYYADAIHSGLTPPG